jgi:perosamine synthetase
MNKLNLPYNRQYLDENDIEAVVSALKSDFITTGPQANLFEQDIARYSGAKYAVACSSGTAALHLALLALNLNKKDSVLTTPNTFVADANAALFVGARVVLSDIRKDNANLDEEMVRSKLRERPDIKVVIPVHFAGQPVDIEAISEISKEFGVTVIEDSCHALGASYIDSKGEEFKVGSCQHSTMSIFSFHPIKSITTGEGGAITTNDENLYKKLKRLRSHGVTRESDLVQNKQLGFSEVDGDLVLNPWYYEMQELAPNYRISDFQCALGRSQLSKLDEFISRRKILSNIYLKEIREKIPKEAIPLTISNNVSSAHHLFVVKINFNKLRGGRAALMIYLKKNGVQTQVNYMPIHLHPYYQDYFKNKMVLPVAEKYYSECLSLPLFFGMGDDDPAYVINLLEEALKILRK